MPSRPRAPPAPTTRPASMSRPTPAAPARASAVIRPAQHRPSRSCSMMGRSMMGHRMTRRGWVLAVVLLPRARTRTRTRTLRVARSRTLVAPALVAPALTAPRRVALVGPIRVVRRLLVRVLHSRSRQFTPAAPDGTPRQLSLPGGAVAIRLSSCPEWLPALTWRRDPPRAGGPSAAGAVTRCNCHRVGATAERLLPGRACRPVVLTA